MLDSVADVEVSVWEELSVEDMKVLLVEADMVASVNEPLVSEELEL